MDFNSLNSLLVCGLPSFVGFVVNVLNRPTDGATVHGQKSASEKELLLVRVGVNTFFIKGAKNYFSQKFVTNFSKFFCA
jgi:hypothetical protein